MLNISNYNVKYEEIKDIENMGELVKVFNLYDREVKEAKLNMSIYENYNNLMMLKDLLKEDLSEKDIKDIIFEIIL